MGAAVLGLGIMLIMQVMGYMTAATLPNTSQAFFLFLALGVTTLSLGQWLGYSVQESARAQEITLKDKTLNDMKVVSRKRAATQLVGSVERSEIHQTRSLQQYRARERSGRCIGV